MKKIIRNIQIAFYGTVLLSACELLDITPKHVVPEETAFSDVDSYQMALNNVFRNLTSSVMNMQSTDFASDDFSSVIPGYAPTNYYIYNWDYQTQPQPFIWTYQYQLIANQNVLIGNYPIVPAADENEQNQIDQIYAQALGLRAWSLFNLVQLYAPRFNGQNIGEAAIPLKIKLELEYLPKATLGEVYGQIFSDLEKAEQLFVESGYAPSSNYKAYQFGLDAVRALRARIALFTGDLEMAQNAAAHFINTPLLPKDDYWMLWEDQFGSGNNEIIFMTHDLSDTDDADLVDYHEMYVTNGVRLSDELMASFSVDDVRKGSSYIGPNLMPYKHIIPENERNSQSDRNLHYKHFRLGEQYLIYAEAILPSDPDEAMRVLNILKEKRGAELLTARPEISDILKERRKELFAEGLRFYDLKRLSDELNIVVQRNNGKVLAPNSPLYVWDIPKVETNSNPYIN
ncbi:SusD family protein [Saccharicrinis carchari]|uniref:SusD family protein n=1 Tax=Saccharicrinis carchari TaxID=1168039 RepID=A0A521AVT6_SACCC|nr:RagB/SusD family nutrient uptake outer membrane protein [Saccharicrinis carchari]SMO38948.1 SusD family protein [Saccharicrinis carchari]